MMVYRSLVVGLLGAIALLVAARPAAGPGGAPVVVDARADAAWSAAEATVVDVSRRAAGADPMPLVGLAPGERVVEVDGAAGDGATLVARWADAAPGQFVDVGARTAGGGARRILVLVHP